MAEHIEFIQQAAVCYLIRDLDDDRLVVMADVVVGLVVDLDVLDFVGVLVGFVIVLEV